MTVTLFIFAGLFALAAGVLFTYSMRAYKGHLPYKTRGALPIKGATKDPQTWDRLHRRTSPLVGTAAVVCLIQALTCAWVAMTPTLNTAGYGLVLIITGIVLPLVLCLMAVLTVRS